MSIFLQEKRRILFIATYTLLVDYMNLIQSLLELVLEEPSEVTEYFWMKILQELP